jgi:dGTPase
LKYPVRAENQDKKNATAKKVGYFESERALVEWVRTETGLKEGERHPLTWIMEACDDIAYSVLDVDDAMKKAVISPDDVMANLSVNSRTKNEAVVSRCVDAFTRVNAANRRPEIARDIKIGYLRAFLIEALIEEASTAFVKHGSAINNFTHPKPLMDDSPLCDALKEIARQHAFGHPSVLRMEAVGAEALDGLMTAFWDAISDRKPEDYDDLLARRRGARNKYVFSLISQNYLDEAANCVQTGISSSIRYRELRLLTDMLSGMTDTFTIKLWEEIRDLK